MPLDSSGTPLKSYTNQSESINNKLTRQKEAMEKNEKSKVNLTKLQFTRDLWEEVDRHQQEELQLAICDLSEEYELADLAASAPGSFCRKVVQHEPKSKSRLCP